MKRLPEGEHRYTRQLVEKTIAQTLEEIRGLTSALSIGRYSYLDDGRELIAGYATGFVSGSFKERGGIVKTRELVAQGYTEAVLKSAGNHWIGSALGGYAAGLTIHGFFPGHAPRLKIDKGLEQGGGNMTATQVPGDLDDAHIAAVEFAQEKNLPFIPPYDDVDVIRGQATIAYELLKSRPDIKHLIVPAGGYGLAAGSVNAVKELGLETKVYGAKMTSHQELCEGSYVAQPGEIPMNILMNNPDIWGGTLYVDPADVGCMVNYELAVRLEHASAMGDAAYDDFPEGTALLAPAAAHRYSPQLDGNIAVILTGGNADHEKLDTLLDFHLASIQQSASIGLQVASGYQLRKSAA